MKTGAWLSRQEKVPKKKKKSELMRKRHGFREEKEVQKEGEEDPEWSKDSGSDPGDQRGAGK